MKLIHFCLKNGLNNSDSSNSWIYNQAKKEAQRFLNQNGNNFTEF